MLSLCCCCLYDVAPTSVSLSSIKNPLSAMTPSPGRRYCVRLDLLVISLSEMDPVYSLDMNVITPQGAMPIKHLNVVWFLSQTVR